MFQREKSRRTTGGGALGPRVGRVNREGSGDRGILWGLCFFPTVVKPSSDCGSGDAGVSAFLLEAEEAGRTDGAVRASAEGGSTSIASAKLINELADAIEAGAEGTDFEKSAAIASAALGTPLLVRRSKKSFRILSSDMVSRRQDYEIKITRGGQAPCARQRTVCGCGVNR